MIFKYYLSHIAVITVILFDVVFCKTCYTAGFSEDCKNCPDFENKFLEASTLKLDEDESSGGVCFKGSLELYDAIKEDFGMKMVCKKETPAGNEMMFEAEGDICSNLDDETQLYHPLLLQMNATSCPINAKLFDVDGLSVDLSFAKDVLTHEYVGEYWVELSVMNGLDALSCHVIGVVISEESCEDE